MKTTLEQTKQRVLNLIKMINHHNHLYYDLAQPTISDDEYDALMQELIALEKQYPQFAFAYSPTQKIGAQLLKNFVKKTHRAPMLSLANVFNHDELDKFFIRAQKLTQEKFTYVCEPKIDGIGISVFYQNGLFQQALTRGDGITGEDVSSNVKTIKNLPLKIAYEKPLEIRGEIFFSVAAFEKFNLTHDNAFKNARNAAAGTLRNLDSAVVAKRPLQVVFYQILDPFSHQLYSQNECLNFLQKLHLPVSTYNQYCTSLSAVKQYVKKMQTERDNLMVKIDGIVIKIDELKVYSQLGYTNKFPRAAVAYKFPSKIALTQLKDIVATIGRSGKLTLNAILEPVFLDGSLVSKATLHNLNFVIDHDIRINDYVYVYKSGDIIPRITDCAVYKRTNIQKPFQLDLHCPVCHQLLEKIGDQVDYFCVNVNCPSRKINALVHFASKDAFNIECLGKKNLEILYSHNFICCINDIFKLHEHQAEILKLNNFGLKSFNVLIDSINKAKANCNLTRLLYALGIPHLGIKSAKILTSYFADIEAIKKASLATLTNISNFGEIIANSVYAFFQKETNLQLIAQLKAHNVRFTNDNFVTASQKLQGLVFVITGTFSHPREHYIRLVEQNGGKIVNTVSKNTNYLLVGEKPGSKLTKAQNLNIAILKEQMFLDML